jgi:hypothetical protein
MNMRNQKEFKVIVKYNCDLNKPNGYDHKLGYNSSKGQSQKVLSGNKEIIAYSEAILFWFDCTNPITELKELMPSHLFANVDPTLNELAKEEDVLEEALAGNLDKVLEEE